MISSIMPKMYLLGCSVTAHRVGVTAGLKEINSTLGGLKIELELLLVILKKYL